MTRDKEIDNAKNAFYKRILEDGYYYDPRDCFEEGADWADANPKSPWISVNDDLPCNHEELIVNHDNAITTIVLVCYCYKGNVYGIDYMFNSPKRGLGWEWSKGTPCYWMPIPNPPKE